MRIKPFDFITAGTLKDALAALEQSETDVKLIAGGTDLVLQLKKKNRSPKTIISLHRLTDLERVEEKGGAIRIGAMARHADLANHPLLVQKIDILCQAVGLIGSWQIRNAGTLGGNICNASPAADGSPPLLVLDADLVLVRRDGFGNVKERTLPVSSFFTGPGQTLLEQDEILKEIRIPSPSELSAGSYLKLRRRKAVDISIAGVAVQVQMDDRGETIEKAGIALGGVAPTPIRIHEAETILLGLTLDEAKEKIEHCARICARTARPIDDLRATADYKRTIVNVFVQRAVRQVFQSIKENRGDA